MNNYYKITVIGWLYKIMKKNSYYFIYLYLLILVYQNKIKDDYYQSDIILIKATINNFGIILLLIKQYI